MPQMATLVLNDGATTPAAHSFVPQQSVPVPTFVEIGGTPLANKVLSCDLRPPQNASGGVYKETVTISYPIVQALTGSNGLAVDTVVRILRSKVELLLPVSSTKQERKDLVAFQSNFFLNATAKTVHEDLLPYYG